MARANEHPSTFALASIISGANRRTKQLRLGKHTRARQRQTFNPVIPPKGGEGVMGGAFIESI